MCIWPDYYGISYRDPRTQALSGIDIDLAQALGHELGVAVQFVDSSFARLVPDLQEGRCDVAMFAIKGLPKEAMEPFLLINCPSILFPFLRRLVADISREGGFPPLLLDPIDFAGLFMRRQQELAAQKPKS